MPQLKKIFEGFDIEKIESDPLQRKYLVCFQEFIRKYKGDIINNHNKVAHLEDRRVRAAKQLVSEFFIVAEPTERDWKVICTVIQWLGSTAGQIYLKSVK